MRQSILAWGGLETPCGKESWSWTNRLSALPTWTVAQPVWAFLISVFIITQEFWFVNKVFQISLINLDFINGNHFLAGGFASLHINNKAGVP